MPFIGRQFFGDNVQPAGFRQTVLLLVFFFFDDEANVGLLGFILGVLVSPWWHALSGFVGAGLLMAGVTGFCGMANLLQVMPWNRPGGPARAGS